jgi:hypothetical protein
MAVPRGAPQPAPVDARPSLPSAWRWGALLWLAVWVPAYAVTWGWRNFLALCDVAALLGCVGLMRSSRLLVASQALPAVVVGVLWTADVAARLTIGRHIFGGTEYMWDPQAALFVRLMSAYHLVLPVVLVLAVRRLGYHRHALLLQAAITLVLLVAARLAAPGANINYAFRDPLFHRALGPAPVHLAAILAGTVVLIYLPAHLFLRQFRAREGSQQGRGP